MSVLKLQWECAGNWHVLDAPQWSDVERAIRALDGKTKTALSMNASGEYTSMSIAGGRRGKYFVDVEKPSLGPVNLVTPDARDDELEMIIEGVGTDFKMWQLVDLPTAMEAARVFFASGELAPSLHWFSGGTREWNEKKRRGE